MDILSMLPPFIKMNQKGESRAGFKLKYRITYDMWMAGYGNMNGKLPEPKDKNYKFIGVGSSADSALLDLVAKMKNHKYA